MINIVLFEPEIPPNTGNIIRLCSNTGFKLHLIEPLGFTLSDKQLRRAGLDYRDSATLKVYPSFTEFNAQNPAARLFACSTRAQRNYAEIKFSEDDYLLFGPETRGLPEKLLFSLPEQQRLRIPMQANSRSLNLSNSVAIVAYEAWRQLDFQHAD